MGRYSSVQSYADNNQAVRSIPYEQATGSAEPKKGKVVTEKVHNPYGSTAGAGSGEFHIYRHARARELERWKSIDEDEQERLAEEAFQQELLQCKTEEERKTAKRRRKRQREKEAKMRKKNLKAAGIDLSAAPAGSTNKKDEEEFTYVPLAEQKAEDEKKEESDDTKQPSGADEPVNEDIPNDGSFLEMMKKRLAEEQASNTEKSDGNSMEPPPPKKKKIVETRIIDEDDEGPVLPPGFR